MLFAAEISPELLRLFELILMLFSAVRSEVGLLLLKSVLALMVTLLPPWMAW